MAIAAYKLPVRTHDISRIIEKIQLAYNCFVINLAFYGVKCVCFIYKFEYQQRYYIVITYMIDILEDVYIAINQAYMMKFWPIVFYEEPAR